MAERPELLGLATEIVSAHVRNNAIAADQLPGLIQKVFDALATCRTDNCCPAEARTGGGGAAFGSCRLHCLPGLRQALLDVEATPDDRSQADARAVPAAMGVATLISLGRTQLRKDKIGTGEEDRIGTEGSGTDECGTKGCSQDGSPQVIQCGSPSLRTYTATCLRSKLCSLTLSGVTQTGRSTSVIVCPARSGHVKFAICLWHRAVL